MRGERKRVLDRGAWERRRRGREEERKRISSVIGP